MRNVVDCIKNINRYNFNIVIESNILSFFSELESQIEQLRDTQRKYSNVLRLSRALASHFYHVVQTQVSKCIFAY